MASAEEKGGCFTFTWEIRNFSLLLAENSMFLCSPVWKVEHTEGIAWASMHAHHSDANVFFFVSEKTGENREIRSLIDLLNRCEMSLISSCGEVPLEVSRHLDSGNFKIDDLLCEKKQSILPNDTLTFRCRMRGEKILTREFRINSVFRSVNHLWSIKDYSSFLTYSTHIEKDNFLLQVDLSGGSASAHIHTVKVEAVSWAESCLNLVDCALFINRICGKVISKTKKEYFYEFRCDIKNIKRVNFKFQMTVALHKIRQDPGSSGALGDDLLRLYRENPLSDATLNTEGKSFHAHRSILAARSPVFRAMFEKDEMSEASLGVVDIDDVDSEIVDLMLVFMYSDSLDGVPWEKAAALYYAADKYAVLSLKQKCADILKTGLTADNFCEAIVLADRHTDEQLMTGIVHFIRENYEVISTEKWDDLQSKNPHLALKISRELGVKGRKK